jgi:hypothetical protein
MANGKQIQSLTGIGGMDYDSDDKYIQEGDYHYIVNGIKIGVGEDGVILNSPGNENVETVASTFLVDNSGSYVVDDLDTVTTTEQDGNIPASKIVGHCKDPKRNGIILFLAEQDRGSIYEFFVAGQIYVPILKAEQALDYSSDVIDATVIGDRLCWLERGGSPKTVNIIKAYNYTHNKGEPSYSSILPSTLSLIKKPPLYRITTEYGYDSDFTGSNVYRKVFQFREQYIYEDSLKSAFGNISDINYNVSMFSYDGNTLGSSTMDNYIDILFNSGSSLVEKVRIAAREGNKKDWYEIAIIDKTNPNNVFAVDAGSVSASVEETSLVDDTDYYYRFYNTGGYRSIPYEEIAKPYENIPIASNHMGAYGNNSLIFGQNQTDYDDIDIDMSMSPRYVARPDEPYEIVISIDNVALQNSSQIAVDYKFDLSNLPATILAGTIINIKAYTSVSFTRDADGSDGTLYAPDPGGLGSNSVDNIVDDFIVLDTDVAKDTFGTNILTYIAFDENDGFDYEKNVSKSPITTLDSGETGSETSASYNSTTDVVTMTYVYDISENITLPGQVVTPEKTDSYAWILSESVKPSLKRGRTRQGAIQYIDDYGRRGEPLTNSACEFRVKDLSDPGIGKGQVKLDVAINHSPPSWASYYQILMSYQDHQFIQVPILYSMPYLDEKGSSTGYIALLLGLTTSVLQDVVEEDIEELEKEINELETKKNNLFKNAGKSIKPWKLVSPFTAIQEGGRLLGLWGDQNNLDQGAVDRANEEIRSLERKVELKKYELTNLYKRALQNVKQYQFSKNDRIRLLKAGNTNADSIADYDSTNYVDDVLDLQVEDVLDSIDYADDYTTETPTTYSGLWLKVKPPNQDGFTEVVQKSKWDNALIEVYRPSYSDGGNIFYETSYIYPITAGAHSDTSFTITPNDCWYKLRPFYTGKSINDTGNKVVDWVEDSHITHDFKSDSYDIGNVFVKTTTEKGIKQSNLVYTNNHIEGTEINGLSQADLNNVIYLTEEYGDIYGIWKSGNTLKVVQAKKITSFYPQGNEMFGRMRQSQTDFGTVYPKSMVDSPYGYRYGFDVYNGVVWRDTNNGVYNISGKSVVRGGVSDYKMGKYFRDVAKEVRDNGILKGSDDVIAAYDEKYELVYFSFLQDNLDSSVVPYRTVMFHEPSNRWVGFLDIQPTGYAYGYNALLSSNESDGNIYLHGRGEDTSGTANYNNFYGTQKNFEAEFVANIMPGIQKVFDAMAIHATTQFSVPEMTIAKNSTTINEKFSKLNTNHFVLQDGVYKSEILGNMKTTSDTAKSRELYNGESMRGYAMKFKLRSSDSEKFELFKVDVYVDPYAT